MIKPSKKAEILKDAQDLLVTLARITDRMEVESIEYNRRVSPITATYNRYLVEAKKEMAETEKKLISLMKKNRADLFEDKDVINLVIGSLIRSKQDKVHIPKNALEACKDNGFKDVIKTVETLNRDAIEKWTDAKLALIGAERKPVVEFKYDLRKTVKSEE